MTIIKQQSVSSQSHQKHLRDYINNDRKVLLREAQNMELCTDLKQWASFMAKTRASFGHDKSARKGKDGKPAKNTILYHQILAFLPDECDVNKRQLSPEDCMRYAKEYAEKHYPHQQIVFALHKEYCREDRTYRYAVHMVINRSDLSTGKRLAEGRGKQAKVERAKRVRALDKAWDLQQVEEGVSNSKVHKKQPSKIEKELALRGERSYKTNLRELCRLAAKKASSLYEYRELLESWGVSTDFRNGRMYAVDEDHKRFSFSVSRLDAALRVEHLEKNFTNTEGSMGMVDVVQIRQTYLDGLRASFLEYKRSVQDLKGVDLSEFPKFRVDRPDERIAQDEQVKRALLAYWRGADELRYKLASNVPYSRKNQKSASRSDAASGSYQVEKQNTLNVNKNRDQNSR